MHINIWAIDVSMMKETALKLICITEFLYRLCRLQKDEENF